MPTYSGVTRTAHLNISASEEAALDAVADFFYDRHGSYKTVAVAELLPEHSVYDICYALSYLLIVTRNLRVDDSGLYFAPSREL